MPTALSSRRGIGIFRVSRHEVSPSETLARAARTCKAFADPASRVLWEVLDGLGPILSVLATAQSSGGPVDALDWARFEHVTERVQALSYRPLRDSDDVLSLIHSRHVDRPIFPNLRALRFRWSLWDGQEEGPFFSVLRNPCAYPALLFLDPVTTHNLETLDAFITECRPERLHLQAPFLSSLHSNSGRVLGRFVGLHTARFGRSDGTMFRLLGSLPRLRTLQGKLAIETNWRAMGTPAYRFSALRKLIVSDEGTEINLPAILPLMSPKSLTVLHLHAYARSSEGMMEYFEELCSSRALAPLRELKGFIELNRADQEPPPSFTDILPSDLKRLPALRDISSPSNSRLPEQPLSSACQPLRHGRRRLAKLAIASLAERCRKLECIEVEFKNVGLDEVERLEARAATASVSQQTELRQIVGKPPYTEYCRKLRIADPSRLAVALRKLFPNLGSGLGVMGEARTGYWWRGYWRCELTDFGTDVFGLVKALDDLHLDTQL